MYQRLRPIHQGCPQKCLPDFYTLRGGGSWFNPSYCECIENALFYDQGFRQGYFSRYPSPFHILHVIFLHSTTDWVISRQKQRKQPPLERYMDTQVLSSPYLLENYGKLISHEDIRRSSRAGNQACTSSAPDHGGHY
jgi:hypothetical protein